MKIKIDAYSDIGCVRETNQDMILLGNQLIRDAEKSLELSFDDKSHKYMLAVADGMGGHLGGDYASEFVLEQIKIRVHEMRLDMEEDELKSCISRWFKELHQLLTLKSIEDPKLRGMGTTFVGLFFYSGKVFLINIGDSRCYRFRNDFLVQISKDHSLSEMTNDANAPSNIIMNSVGGGKDVFAEIEEISTRILNDDLYLLCSDGLNGELSDEIMEGCLLEKGNFGQLLQKAKNEGGADNISYLVLNRYVEEVELLPEE